MNAHEIHWNALSAVDFKPVTSNDKIRNIRQLPMIPRYIATIVDRTSASCTPAKVLANAEANACVAQAYLIEHRNQQTVV